MKNKHIIEEQIRTIEQKAHEQEILKKELNQLQEINGVAHHNFAKVARDLQSFSKTMPDALFLTDVIYKMPSTLILSGLAYDENTFKSFKTALEKAQFVIEQQNMRRASTGAQFQCTLKIN